MNEKAEQLKARTAAFAKSVVTLCDKVVVTDASRVITNQLIDAATSAAANYRAACRPRSRREFVAKIGIALEEADEALGWLQMLVALKALTQQDAEWAINEADEITAILNASYHTAKRRLKKATNTKSTNQQSAIRK
jgi:four helix bundle protein